MLYITIHTKFILRLENNPGIPGVYYYTQSNDGSYNYTTKTTTRITDALQENKCAYRCAAYYSIIAIQQRRPHNKLHSEVIDVYLNPIEHNIT